MRRVQYGLVALLRSYSALTAFVGTRIYPPGVEVGAQLPRISVTVLTPSEPHAGAGLGAGVPTFRNFIARVDVHAGPRMPQLCDAVAEEVEDAVATNRTYHPGTVTMTDYTGKTVTKTANGYFLLLKVTGGSETILSPALGHYVRTIQVGGQWFQSAVG